MNLPPVHAIDTPRLAIRPVDAADLPPLLQVNGDPEVTRYLPYATWRSIDDAAAWLARMEVLAATGTAQQLVLVSVDTSVVVGTLLLFRHDATSRRLELGYVLGRSHWRQGLMREALSATCTHLFGPLGMRRIEAEVNPDNVASCQLLSSLGFTLEGRLRQRWVAKGSACDTAIYGLLSDDPQPAGR